MHTLWWLIFVLIISVSASGAVLEGKVYDLSLMAIDKAVVEINTTPVQRTVTDEGFYSLVVDPGTYEILAKSLRKGVVVAETKESTIIPKNGTFELDLILFPEILEEVEPVAEPDVEENQLWETNPNPYFFVWRAAGIILSAILAWGIYVVVTRRKKRQMPQEFTVKVAQKSVHGNLEDIISIIRKAGGRITQKDLRKELPHSEAKVSLMLDELESKGRIEKIKKGRGNIVILKE